LCLLDLRRRTWNQLRRNSALIALIAEREHHERCYISRKKSAVTESVVRFNVYVDIQAYSSWNKKK